MKKGNDKIWHELTIGQFQQLQNLGHLEVFDQMKSVVSISDGVSIGDVDEMPLADVQKRAVAIMDGLKKMPFTPFKSNVWIGGKRWKIVRMFDELKTNQMVEYFHWTREKSSGEIIANLHNIMATLMVENPIFGKIQKYDGTNHKHRAELVQREMKIIDAMSVANFFLVTWMEFTNNIPGFLETMMTKMKTEGTN